MLVGKDLNTDIPKVCLADVAWHWRMSLKSEGAPRQPCTTSRKRMFGISLFNSKVEHGLAVEFDDRLARRLVAGIAGGRMYESGHSADSPLNHAQTGKYPFALGPTGRTADRRQVI